MSTQSYESQPSGQALPAGTRLEEFVIERVLGSGGFGITYLARDTSLGRQVVIKENLPAQFSWRDPASGSVRPRSTHHSEGDDYEWSLRNFLREAETLASLDHPGIVRVLRKFEAHGTAYFVMPFMDGVAFDELIAERHEEGRPFNEEEIRGLLDRMLEALAYLHDRGIYHRDIKPGNILVTLEGIPVLIDFGSARQRLGERSMTVVESPGYTPFEQLQSKGRVGPWSDLYALAATLVKAMTFENLPKAADRVMDDPWQGLIRHPTASREFTRALLTSIERALRVKVNERWQDAREWQHALAGGQTFAWNETLEETTTQHRETEQSDSSTDWQLSDDPVTQHLAPRRRLSKSVRQTLIAGIGGLAVIGLFLVVIKNSGRDAKQSQTEILKTEGRPVSAAEVEPAEWRKMAEAGDPFAQALLGDALFWGGMRGKGIPKDQGEGQKWIQTSAEAGHPLGLFLRGLATESENKEAAEKDFETSIEKGLLRDVDDGGPIWWTAVAVHLSRDLDNAENLKQSYEWSRKAAATGYIDAMSRLGECYERGRGVEKDLSLAVLWYRKSADAGSPEAMTQLGLHHSYGFGVAQDHAEAASWFRKAADLGEAEAQNCLGDAYAQGEGVPKDLKQAAHWYQQAANQGDSEGQYLLASAYEEGEGVAKDFAMAAKWYRKAAEQGNAAAQSSLGDLYLEGEGVTEDPAEAVKWFKMAAEQGNGFGQTMLGRCYQDGTGVAQNLSLAVEWFNKAAVQEYALAEYLLGDSYLNGTGVEKNAVEAFKWIERAAKQGLVAAQADLGLCYAKAIGVTKNEIEAAKWYRLAAERGYDEAQFFLAECYAAGQGVDQDLEHAAKWFRKAADQGLDEAQHQLALCYYRGEGVPKNSTEAVKWCRLAADQNHIMAQYNMGYLYANGEGVVKDLAEAAKWYRKAAERGHAGAQEELGDFYSDGSGVAKNPAEAAKWHLKAAEQGSAHSQFCLAYAYEKGDGVSRDQTEAAKWYLKAAEQGQTIAQNNIGVCYADGQGVYKDPVRGLMWLIIASEAGNEQARENLRLTAKEITSSQISQARRMAAEWQARKKAEEPPAE